MRQDEIEALGKALAEARRAGRILLNMDLRRVPGRDEAEAVQAEAVMTYGQPTSGYTLAATTSITGRLLNCQQPAVAPLFDNHTLPSGSPMRLSRSVLGVGAQFTFVFGRSFPLEEDDPLCINAVKAAIVSCYISLQVLGRRVPHLTPLNDWTATADFGLDVAHVRGSRVANWQSTDLSLAEVSLWLDRNVLARGSGGDILDRHPLAAVAWLADTLSRRGRTIDAGDAVATGSCTGLSQVVPGQHVSGDFGPLGSVELRLE